MVAFFMPGIREEQLYAIETVISYLLLRGQCASCGASYSPRYMLVEALTGLLAGIVALHFVSAPIAVGGALLLTFALITLTGIDYDTYLLPDNITLPLLWAALP